MNFFTQYKKNHKRNWKQTLQFQIIRTSCILLLLMCTVFASAQTIPVNPCGGSGNTLQDALDALTTTNQTILVDPAHFTNQSPGGNWGLSTIDGTGGLYDGLTIDFQGAYVIADAAGLGLLDVSGIDNMTIKNLTLDGFNRSNGAINVDYSEGTLLENVKFVNSPTTQPMAINSTSGNTSVTFRDCLFSGNPVTSASPSEVPNTGAIQLVGNDAFTLDVTFENTEFRCNARQGSGGAVQILGDGGAPDRTYTSVTFTDCVFANNFTSGSSTGGGAIYANDQTTVTITGTIFYNNYVTGSTTNASGGAIHINGETDLILTDCYFTDNYTNGGAGSHDGGAIGTQGGSASKNNVTMTGCVFTGNSCPDEGGGVFFRHAQTVNVTNCLFANNNSPDGGAFHIENAGNYTIDGLTSTGTSGKDFENNSGTGTIDNSIITGSNTMGSLTQTNCTIGSTPAFTNPMPGGTTDPATYNYDVAGSQGTTLGVMPSVTSNTDCLAEALSPPSAAAPCDALGIISGSIFLDNFGDGTSGNNDGTSFATLDGTSGGVDTPLGTTVYLYSCTLCDGSDDVLEQEITTTTGDYTFLGIDAGNYFVAYDTPSGHQVTVSNTTDAGADGTVDSDDDTGQSHVMTIAGGSNWLSNDSDAASGFSNYSNINAGYYEPITVEGTLYGDENFTIPEPNTSFNLTVIYANGSMITVSGSSDGTGAFSITGFPPGDITGVSSSFGNIDQSSVIGGSGTDGTAAGPSNALQASGSTLTLQDFALPVELISFRLKSEDCDAILEWKTASEENASHFSIEKINDRGEFVELSRVEAVGNSAELLSYSYRDKEPIQNAMYRLKIVDMDGSYAYSNSVAFFDRDCANSLMVSAVFPNPVKNNLNIQLSSLDNQSLNLQIIDVSGKILVEELYAISRGDNNLILKIDMLSNGLYFINISDESGTKKAETIRFAKY